MASVIINNAPMGDAFEREFSSNHVVISIFDGSMPSKNEMQALVKPENDESLGSMNSLGIRTAIINSGRQRLLEATFSTATYPCIKTPDGTNRFEYAQSNTKFTPLVAGLGTWFILAWCSTNTMSSGSCYTFFVGTVGDLDSSADLKFPDPNFLLTKQYKFNDIAIKSSTAWQ